MAATCASCGAAIHMWPNNTYYCPKCKTFSCRFCRNDDDKPCPVCGTEKAGWDFSSVPLGFTIIILMTSGLLLSLTVPSLIDGFNMNNMQVTPMDQVAPDTVVKISGRIDSNNTIAISGHEEYDKDWKWVLDTNPINITNGRGTPKILLNLSQARILPGPHTAEPASEHLKGTVYKNNDTIYALGKITRTNGTTTMTVYTLSPQEHVFTDFHDEKFVFNYLLIVGIAVVFFIVFLKYMEYLGRKAISRLSGNKPRVPPWNFSPMENVSSWRNKIVNPNSRTNILEGTVSLGMVLIFIYCYIRYPLDPVDEFRTGVLMLLSLLAGMPMMFLAVNLLTSYGPRYYIPVKVSIGDDGFGAKYRDGNVKGVRWSDIHFLLSTTEIEKPDKKSDVHGVVIFFKERLSFTIPELSRENAQNIAIAFRKRKPSAENDFLKALVTSAPKKEVLDKLADAMIDNVKLDKPQQPEMSAEKEKEA